jgi:hypothetical protein
MRNPFRYFNSSPEVIRLTVMNSGAADIATLNTSPLLSLRSEQVINAQALGDVEAEDVAPVHRSVLSWNNQWIRL